MNRQVFEAMAYLRHWMKRQSKYKVHSPFVYDFYKEVVINKHPYSQYRVVNRMRKELVTVSRFIKRKDMGAMCREFPSDQRFVRVGDIARKSAVSEKKGELLFRLARWARPDSILELGTSLGISTMYLSLACPETPVATIEGCIDSANIARENFDRNGMKMISVFTGEFSDRLGDVYDTMPSPGLVFIDGNHRKKSTVSYFEQCLQHIKPTSVLVFDDIYWSPGMEEAWNEISSHPSVKVSVDLYYFGILFFREELSKEHFILHF